VTAASDAQAPTEPSAPSRSSRDDRPAPIAPHDRRFYGWLLAVTVVGLGWRLWDVLVIQRDMEIWGDGYFYHHAANLLAEGRGWINPFFLNENGVVTEAADHPPLYILYLAGFSAVGLDSPLAHQLASTLLGAGTIWLAGLAGRQIGGRRLGLVGAAIVAVYPNIWLWDGLLLSETMAILTVTLTVWLAYRFWRDPGLWPGVALGASVGLAALARAELLLLSVLVVLPLCLLARRAALRTRIAWLAGAAAACVLVITPWVANNLTRFDEPVYLSNGLDITLATANCPYTYDGKHLGYWRLDCVKEYMALRDFDEVTGDQTEKSRILREETLDFISNNTSQLPKVVLARWGRVTGLYSPMQQSGLDAMNERIDPWVPKAGLVAWYPIVVLAGAGALVLWRRRTTLIPLLGPPIIVAFVVTAFFGQPRYRAIAEVPIALLAAVALERLWTWWRARRASEPPPPLDEVLSPYGA
jgi:4-amino-4-deoxy-L-arabinose transferase-like glycosyltransferase